MGHASSAAPTRLLAVVVSDVANPFYSQLVRGAQVAATQSGYEILLVDARESGSRERSALERILPVAEGIVIGGSRLPDAALRVIAKQKPVVVLNRELRDIPSVVADNLNGMQGALASLRALGHDAVVYLSGPEASWTNGVRSRAFRDYGTQLGMQVHKIGPFLPTVDGGQVAAAQIVDHLPTAIIAYNDLLAVGLIHGLTMAGVGVPSDVSVVGFDDIPIAQLVTPTLTTVAAPVRQMGVTGVENVVAIINGARPRGEGALVLPMRLRTRDSTGPRRSRAH